MDLDAYIGLRLQRLRQKKAVDIRRLAHLICVNHETYMAYENGSKRIPAKSLYDLACYLDVQVTYFVDSFEKSDDRPTTSATKHS